MQSFLDLAKKRHSVRHYLQKDVEKEKILKVVEAARIAPSATNRQPWHFIVIRDKEIRTLVSVSYNKDWLREAPVIIVACGDHKTSWIRRFDEKDHCDIDISIAVDHMTLAATELGLGTCWICAFNAQKLAQMLELPPNLEPIVILPLGYPAYEADVNRHVKQRKPMEEILHWEKYFKKTKF